jgi:hypothetical protein
MGEGTRCGLREAALAARRALDEDGKITLTGLQREVRRFRLGHLRRLHDPLTLSAAAWLLVVSKAEVKRLIADGSLSGETEAIDEDRFRWLIPLDEVIEIGERWLRRSDAGETERASRR